MQIIKKLFFSHFSVNKGLIQHVVQSCYNYNITFRKLEIHSVNMRPISACYTSGRGARHFLGIGRCTISSVFTGSKDRACDRESREDHGKRKGRNLLVHIGTNNADKEGTTAIVDKYRKLLKKTKEARVEQIILSGILPVFDNRIDGYRNSKRMAINGMVKRLCKEDDVGYVDLWDSFVGKEEMYVRDGLHLSGKGAAVFAEGLSMAVASGLGKVRYLN